MNRFVSSYPGISWPALPQPYSAGLMAMLFQLEQTQWWPAERIAAEQARQLSQVVEHAYRTVPYYRQQFDALNMKPVRDMSADFWQQIPLLRRRDLQLSEQSLQSCDVPKQHGDQRSTTTSGSTGQSVTTQTTDITSFFWQALTLRDHFWHRRDFSRTFAAIRYTPDPAAAPPLGQRAENWGSTTAAVVMTGPGFLLDVTQSNVEEQLAWLQSVDPAYVLSYPSVLLLIAQLMAERGLRLPNLREVCTFGEILEQECRAACQRTFGTKVVDMYSSQEVGYIALQCPEHEHYHLQSESLLVEVLDDAGRPCAPGEVGKVVVTTLHNFAMPLLRYDIGDYAEVGEPCPCGRGLPVLKRILGRQRNWLVYPNGERRWPVFGEGERPEELPPFYQFQLVQRTREEIDVSFVRDADYTVDEASVVTRYIQQTLGHPFKIRLQRVDSIPRNPTGKFEDFISLAQ